ncbi:unnamed protein product [Clonostachys rhizophaga]|uniref:Beta-lactamase-related domain-containing protein n=1 Tax=Clonostachys rhizophaga TaxID=160324 RepID=A0A9N9V3W9_9HYPO|nr:unnamed protein product [Clonostachys rhizophaga]
MLFTAAVACALVAGSSAFITGTDDIPLIGPSFLSNVDLSNSQHLQDAKSEFSNRIDELFSSGKLNRTDLVFAVDIFSANTNGSIHEYFHVGEGQEEVLTSGRLDFNTIGRLGSVSKLFTAYALVAEAGIEVFSHPVTRYFPELRGNSSSVPLSRIHWDEITVGALASHQAGTGGVGDFFLKYAQTPEKITTEAFVSFLRDEKRPNMPAYRNALYSDAGYSLLGHVLARITGQSYPDSMQKILFGPLGMNSTTAKPPTGPDLNAINRYLVDNTSSWNVDVQVTTPSGGIFSSLADMRKVGLSILNSEIITPATTRAWMKPLSATGSLVELVGAPWEISRLTIPATPGSNRTRVSDLYTKAGGNGDYTAVLGLSPDHGFGFSLLVAGKTASSARWPIRQAIGEIFVPAAERAAAVNAQENLTGTFIDENSENTNITLSFEDGKPGLGLDSFYVEGKDSRYLLQGAKEPSDAVLRIYPTGPSFTSSSLTELYRTKGTLLVSHRFVAQRAPTPPRASALGGEGLFENYFEWMNIGFNGPLDELVFEIEDGKLVSVTIAGAELASGKQMVLKRLD